MQKPSTTSGCSAAIRSPREGHVVPRVSSASLNAARKSNAPPASSVMTFAPKTNKLQCSGGKLFCQINKSTKLAKINSLDLNSTQIHFFLGTPTYPKVKPLQPAGLGAGL